MADTDADSFFPRISPARRFVINQFHTCCHTALTNIAHMGQLRQRRQTVAEQFDLRLQRLQQTITLEQIQAFQGNGTGQGIAVKVWPWKKVFSSA